MAKVIDYAVTIYTAVTANMVLEMPEHQAGDLLVACLNKDSAIAFTTLAGWYAANAALGTGHATGIYTKRAQSAAETATFALTSETCIGVVLSIRGQYWDGTTQTGQDALVDVVGLAAIDSTLPFTGSTFTSRFDNILVIHALGGDAVYGTFPLPGIIQIFGGDTGANSLAVGYDFLKTKGATYTPSFWSGTAPDDTRAYSIGIKDNGTGIYIPGYVDNAVPPASLISPLINNVAVPNRGTLKTSAQLDLKRIVIPSGTKKNIAYAAVTTNSADVGYNPFHGVVRHPGLSSTTTLAGNELTMSVAEDCTLGQGVIFGMWQFTSPRDYLDLGKSATGGTLVGVADVNNYSKFWCVGGQLSKTTTAGNWNNYCIQVAGSTPTYSASGAIALNAVNDFYFIDQGYYGAASMDSSQLWLLYGTKIYGGSASVPLNFDDIETCLVKGASNVPLMQRSGSAATFWTPVQFGGKDVTQLAVNLRTLQYPTQADGNDFLDFHVDNNYMGFEFYGLNSPTSSGGPDGIAFTNCVFTSDSPYYWRFNSLHASAADLDFSGSTVVNATVTLRPSVQLEGTSFIDCPTFTQNNATLRSCTFDNTTIISTNIGRISDSTFIAPASAVSSGAYGIILNTPGTYQFPGNSFTGFAAVSGSTGREALLNNSAGHVTINVTGGGEAPSIRNSYGGSWTTINNYKVLTLTGIQNNSEVRILSHGTTTELAGIENVVANQFQYSYNYIPNVYVDIVIHNLAYQYYRIDNYLLTNGDASIPISQTIDRNYNNP